MTNFVPEPPPAAVLKKAGWTLHGQWWRGFFGLMLVLVVMLLSFSTSAQTPCFDIDGPGAACAPATFVVRNCVVGTNVFYIPDSTNPAFIVNGRPSRVDTVRYTQPGKYRLGQGILVAGRNIYLYKTVYVLRPQTPVPTVRTCDNFLVQLNIPKQEGERFVVDYGGGVKDTTDDIGSTQTSSRHRYTGLDPNPATIRVQSLYNCGRDTVLTVPLRTALLGPDSLELRTLQNGQTLLRLTSSVAFNISADVLGSGGLWSPLTVVSLGINQFQLLPPGGAPTSRRFRIRCQDDCGTVIAAYELASATLAATSANEYNGLAYTTLNDLLDAAQTTISRNGSFLRANSRLVTSFTARDSAIACGRTYCYVVAQTWPVAYRPGRTTAVTLAAESNYVIGASRRQPSAIRSLSISMRDGSCVLTWKAPQGFSAQYYLVKQFNRGREISIDTVRGLRYVDPEVYQPDSATVYAIQYRDSCGNLSVLPPRTGPVFLTLDELGERVLRFRWNRIGGWIRPPRYYEFEQLDNRNQVVLRTVMSNDSTRYTVLGRFDASQRRRFRIRAVPDTNLLDTAYSNIVESAQTSNVIMPNAFSPNGDKINDVYLVKASFLREFSMKIVDRWGLIVYESTDPEAGWDGLVSGVKAPIGVYVAVVRGRDQMGNNIETTQMVTLLR